MDGERGAVTINLTSYDECREALRSRELRQALYDEGAAVMDDVIVNLHGEPHVARRRLENRLFRRDTFAWYERDRIPAIVEEMLRSPRADGRVDLLPLARRTMMILSVEVAGVDRPPPDRFEHFHHLMDAMARAATVVHATGDKAAITAAGIGALEEFETEFYRPSFERRRQLVDAASRGELSPDSLPRDVLTTLLVNHDRLDLPPDTILREVAYYPWVGSHSTSNQFVHAMHHLLDWIERRPDDRRRLTADGELRQRFVHESLRLHPASPVAVRVATSDVRLRSGRILPAGDRIVIDLVAANRDPAAVGAAPDTFDPFRVRADDVPPWALSFGTGTHACLGMELAGGLAPDLALDHHLLGAITVMAGMLLVADVRLDPGNPPQHDPTTTRAVWGSYPVLLD